MSLAPICLHSLHLGVPVFKQAKNGSRGRSVHPSGGHHYIVDYTIYPRLKDAREAIEGFDFERREYLTSQWAKRLEAKKEILVGGAKP